MSKGRLKQSVLFTVNTRIGLMNAIVKLCDCWAPNTKLILYCWMTRTYKWRKQSSSALRNWLRQHSGPWQITGGLAKWPNNETAAAQKDTEPCLHYFHKMALIWAISRINCDDLLSKATGDSSRRKLRGKKTGQLSNQSPCKTSNRSA